MNKSNSIQIKKKINTHKTRALSYIDILIEEVNKDKHKDLLKEIRKEVLKL